MVQETGRGFSRIATGQVQTLFRHISRIRSRVLQTTSARCVWVWLPECVRVSYIMHPFLCILSSCISVAGRNAWRQSFSFFAASHFPLHDVVSTNNDGPYVVQYMLPYAFRRRVEMHGDFMGGVELAAFLLPFFGRGQAMGNSFDLMHMIWDCVFHIHR